MGLVSRFPPIGRENWHKRGPNSHSGINSKSGPSGKTYGTRKRNPKPWNPEFVGIDGEGYTDESGVHHYFLMACSDGTFISDTNGLDTNQCFDYLFSIKAANRGKVLVCYGASYDINMMLKGLPEATVDFIYHNSGVIFVNGVRYWIRYTPRKTLQLSRWKNDKRESLTLYDCIGFFQQPFVDALEEWLGKDHTDLERIRNGKSKRSQFRVDEIHEILLYCQAELYALVLLMSGVRDSLKNADIRIGQWYGPGAIASALLKEHKTKEHMSDTYHLNREVYNVAQRAFAGGRIELLQYGKHDGTIYHYDINSAYPSIIAELPSMDSIEWHHSTMPSDWNSPVSNFALYHIKWSPYVDAPFYPFHYRNPHGMIFFPAWGEGWYWGVEVNAALEYFDGNIEFIECWWPKFNNREQPFKWVKELYDKRRILKADGNAAHRTIKLGLNSLYGKLIQHVGGDKLSDRLPAFHQLEWAGYITAATRAKLYAAGMQNPNAIIGFQTDGIFSTEPLNLKTSDELGEWTEEPKCSKGLFIQSGIYWIWEAESGREIGHYRGFDNGSLSSEMMEHAYTARYTSILAKSTRFISMSSAIQNQFEKWCTWQTIDRELMLTPDGTKRMDCDECEGNPSTSLVSTRPQEFFYRRNGDGCSEPYQLPWETWENKDDYVDGVRTQLFEAEHEETYF